MIHDILNITKHLISETSLYEQYDIEFCFHDSDCFNVETLLLVKMISLCPF